MTTICDKCKNYYVSPSGTTETCMAPRYGSMVIPNPTQDYIDQRMNGNKTNCKAYDRLSIKTKARRG